MLWDDRRGGRFILDITIRKCLYLARNGGNECYLWYIRMRDLGYLLAFMVEGYYVEKIFVGMEEEVL